MVTVCREEKFSQRLLYFSSYLKILRTVAWILRFCHNARRTNLRVSTDLTGEEIQRAEQVSLRLIQSEWNLEQKDKYSKSMKFYNDAGIIKVETRLILSDDPDDFIRPTVLPDHPVVRRLIEDTHKALRHAGVQTTLSRLRERFWIPRGRRVVREVIHNCLPCKRYSSKKVIPKPAPLPTDRIHRVAAFQVTGADLAGPLYLRGGEKAWIVLFTCAVYRAIHLELITSLSTEAFMQTLRRFLARRGRCSMMYTDNGTNFTGAARALRALDWKEIEAKTALFQIKWRFSPPAAPWYGGWWERMVRCIKDLLRKNLGKACLNYEEMITLLCDCECTINNRPLTYVSDDPNELRPITPSHFIQDLREQETLDLDIIDSRHLLRRVKYLQELREKLRRRFKEEYLGELVRNPQLSFKRDVIAPGDIVLIGTDNLKRISWPMARVIELFPGKDQVQRVARLRVAAGEVIRPLQRLYPLELHQTELMRESFSTKPGETPVEFLPVKSDVNFPQGQSKTLLPNRKKTNGETSKGTKETVSETRCGRLVKPPLKLDL